MVKVWYDPVMSNNTPADRPALTARQSDAYSALVHMITADQHPTLLQVADRLGVGKVTAYEHVLALIQKGYITRATYKSRSIALIEPIATEYVKGRTAADELARMAPVLYWLELNSVEQIDEIVDLLISTNDNPNIVPLPEDYQPGQKPVKPINPNL